MDSCIEPVANCNLGSDPTLVSKPAGPVIEIDSIAIDFNCANVKSYTRKCDHFSIRGYVAEMRKKDWKICWPFPLEDDSSASVLRKPTFYPLDVPKFRSSYCQDCLHSVSAKIPNEDTGAASNHCNTGLKLSIGTHVSSADVAAESPQSHQELDLEVVERGEIDLNNSVFVNNSKTNAYASNDIEKEVIVAETAITGHVNVPNIDVQKMYMAGKTAIEAETVIADQSKYESSALKKAGCSDHHGVGDGHVPTKCLMENSVEICQNEERTYVLNQDMELVPANGMSDADATEGHFAEAEDSGNVSSESLEDVAGNNNQSCHKEKSKSLQRKKVRKVRLLTELLGKDEEPSAKHARTEDLSVNADSVVAARGAILGVQGHAVVKENAKRGPKGQNRKRKLSQDEEWRPAQASLNINGSKKIHNVQRQSHEDSREESKDSDSATKTSKTISDTLSAQRTEPSTSIERIKTKNILYKKKGKMPQIDDGPATLGTLQNGHQTAPKNVRQDAVTKQGLHISLDNYQKCVPEVEDELLALLLRRDCNSKEDRPRRKDIDPKNVVNKSQHNSAQDALFGQRDNYDLNSNSIYRVPNLNEEQSSQGEHAGDLSFCPMVSSGTNHGKKIVKTQEHLPARNMCDDQRSAELSEQVGAIDDATMEIVELMARNQYERRLPDSSSNKSIAVAGQKQRSQAASGRNGLIIKGKIAEPAGQNSRQFYPHSESDGHPNQDQNQGFSRFPQAPDWPPRQKQVNAGSSRLTGGEYHNSLIGAVGPGSKHAFVQDSGMLKICASFPQRSGEAVPPSWYSKPPNCLPCNIHQNSAASQVNIDVFSNRPWHKGNVNGVQNSFLNLNATSSRNYNTEAYARTQIGYPLPCKRNKIDLNQSPTGLLDLNSNETMSAVQLLTLMDAGKRAGPPFNTDGATKYHKESSRSQLDNYLGFGASTSVQPGQSVLRATAFTDHSPLMSREQDRTQALVSSSGNSTQHKRGAPLGAPGDNYEGTAVDRKQELTPGSSNKIILPLPKHGVEICSTSSAGCSSKRNTEPEMICVVNRNPAEFTSPGSDNEYMIKPEDLKIGKKFLFKDKSKRRNMNRISGRVRSRN